MAKTAILSGANPALSRGDDPPYPPRDSRRMAETAIVPGANPPFPGGTPPGTPGVVLR
jgi:hypothetical protein